jgi:catechol 2,3-dioxygenase-like lactoylglutathione lyase family enzyme
VIQGFHHLAIQCADLALCERFYHEVLGLPVLKRWPSPEGGDRSVWLAIGDGFVALERASEGSAARPWSEGKPGIHLLALKIDASLRGEWEARLQSRGVEVVHRTAWTIYVRDPEGNRIGLSHHPDAAEAP